MWLWYHVLSLGSLWELMFSFLFILLFSFCNPHFIELIVYKQIIANCNKLFSYVFICDFLQSNLKNDVRFYIFMFCFYFITHEINLIFSSWTFDWAKRLINRQCCKYGCVWFFMFFFWLIVCSEEFSLRTAQFCAGFNLSSLI